MTEHEREDYWRINGLPDGINALPIDGHVGPEPTATYGESYDCQVRLTPDSDSEAARWPDHRTRYERLLAAYAPHAGKFTLHQLTDGTVAYTEMHGGPGLLVALRPPADAAGRGGYYLVSSVEDETTLPETLAVLAVELTYVAPLSEYADVQRANKMLEAETI